MKEIFVALIGALGVVLGVLVAQALQWYRGYRAAKRKAEESFSTAEIEDRAKSYSLLIAAYNQMIQAERAWTQKEIEIERARYIAEEKLGRRIEEHSRELKEARRFTEEQHEEIVRLEAVIEERNQRISKLETQVEFTD